MIKFKKKQTKPECYDFKSTLVDPNSPTLTLTLGLSREQYLIPCGKGKMIILARKSHLKNETTCFTCEKNLTSVLLYRSITRSL